MTVCSYKVGLFPSFNFLSLFILSFITVFPILPLPFQHMSFFPFRKGKAVPLQAWSGLEGSSKLRFPDFMTTAQDSGKVVSLTHRRPLPPGNVPVTNFC